MRIFTTGEAANVLKVSSRVVCRWFDSGRLRGYRLPGSQERRIPLEYLVKFCKEHGMPVDDLEQIAAEDAAHT